MNLSEFVQSVSALFDRAVVQPVTRFFTGLSDENLLVFFSLLAGAVVIGFLVGRSRPSSVRRRLKYQNRSEALVTRVLRSEFSASDFHLMNHLTIQMDDGTTEVDHVLVSRFGVFVIETKDYKGWIFANALDRTWTQVIFRLRFKFQNPIHQNMRHVRAIQAQLDFLPHGAIKPAVVFTGDAVFKAAIPEGVFKLPNLIEYIRNQTEEVMSLNRVQFCVGRLETARLAISRETDVEHTRSLERRHGYRR